MEMQEGGGLFKGVVSEKGGQLGVNRGHCRVWAGGSGGGGGGAGQSSGRKSRALPLRSRMCPLGV